MEVPQNILVVGLGASGIAVAEYLMTLGRIPVLTDQKSEKDVEQALARLNARSYRGSFGGHRREDFLAADLIVISPGVDTEMTLLREARERGIPVIGEIELAASLISQPIVAVTGTNGKTTTTALTGEIFSRAFGNVFVGGNIGNPLIRYVTDGALSPYLIVEISSFQLETIRTFRPWLAMLLNITEDHLDRYRSYDEYIDAKWRIFENQGSDDYALLNDTIENPRPLGGRKLLFSVRSDVKEGAFYRNGKVYVRMMGQEWVYDRRLSPLYGIHNTENILAALIAAHSAAIPQETIETVLAGFRGLAHRVEFVRTVKGVTFLNDSKATNVDATRRALESVDGTVVLIAGGKDKGGSYDAIRHFEGKIRSLVLIGEARERIAREIGDLYPVSHEESLEGAVERAFSRAADGDVVLFSPMCSSFDMFRDYKDRGNQFKEIVGKL